MMHPSLILLGKLRLWGQWRQLKRTLSSPKGIALAFVSLGFFGMSLFPLMFSRNLPENVMPLVTWVLHPAVLLLFWLATVAGSSMRSPIAFSMPEVEFLFPGPYSRRELLTYKLLATLVGTFGFAVMMTLFMPWAWMPAVFVGLWLTTTFVQWSAVLIALVTSWLELRMGVLLVVLVVLAVLGLAAAAYEADVFAADLEFRQRLEAFDASWTAQVALAPFVVFSRAISARTFGELIPWSAAALAIVSGMAAAILWLDVGFLEASLAASRSRYEALQRLKRSGGVSALSTRSTPRFGLPVFPRLRGAGTIAWYQAVQMLRGSGRLIILAPMLAAPFVVLALMANHRPTQSQSGIVLAISMLIAFLISTLMPLGMRSELDCADAIKSLPIGNQPIVWGSLGTGIAYITLVQLFAVAAASLALRRWTTGASLSVALALPVNLLLVASDSVLVLLFPSTRRLNPNDPLSGARLMLINMAKLFFTLFSAALGGAAALLARLIFGDSLAAMTLAGCGMLFIVGLATVWLAALLFGRYDPSTDVTTE